MNTLRQFSGNIMIENNLFSQTRPTDATKGYHPLRVLMGLETVLTSIALVGGFIVGLWYIFTRKDVTVSARQGMSPEGLRYGSGSPGFGSAKKEIDRKLAIVEDRRRRQEAIAGRLALENAERQAPVSYTHLTLPTKA